MWAPEGLKTILTVEVIKLCMISILRILIYYFWKWDQPYHRLNFYICHSSLFSTVKHLWNQYASSYGAYEVSLNIINSLENVSLWRRDGKEFKALETKVVRQKYSAFDKKLKFSAQWRTSFSKQGFNSMRTKNFRCSLDLGKTEEPEIKLATSVGSQKNKRIPEKRLLLLHWLG